MLIKYKKVKSEKLLLNKKIKEELRSRLGPVGFAIYTLMDRSKINWQWKLEKEELLSIHVADMLRELTLSYQEKGVGLKAVWCHVPNEGKRNPVTAIILRAMGMIPGAFDFWFCWENGSGIIELKAGTDLSDSQVNFGIWAKHRKVNQSIQSSVSGVLDVLKSWGAIV